MKSNVFFQWPDTEHLDYEESADQIRLLLDQPSIYVPIVPPIEAVFHSDDLSPINIQVETRKLNVRQAAGPAPYVDRPFVYRWRVAEDDSGRWVAGSAEIVYIEDLAALAEAASAEHEWVSIMCIEDFATLAGRDICKWCGARRVVRRGPDGHPMPPEVTES